MIFVIIGYDGTDGQVKRRLHRDAHLQRMDALDKAGKVILAGPLTDGAGSLIIIEAASLSEAQAFADSDPYVTEEVFARYEIHPFMQIYPKL